MGTLKVTPSHDRDDYEHAVGKCCRYATVIEPTTSKQWFVSVRPLADKAVAAVREGRIKLYPDTSASA